MRKRKCRNCDDFFRPAENAPAFIKWCSDECRLALALASLTKIRQESERKLKLQEREVKKKHAKRKREFYANDKGTRRRAAVEQFHRFIRNRDHGRDCISCGKPFGSSVFDSGHYIPAGSCAALRFDEHNVNLQCHYNCNIQQSGNRTEYRKGLIKKYGEAVVARLEGPQPTVKMRAEDYKAIEDKYKKLNERKS